MTQLSLELEARDYGMAEAAKRNPDWLELFREIALEIYERRGKVASFATVCIDDVRAEAERRGYVMPTNCQWMGSVFKRKSDGWRMVNTVCASHEGSHARRVGVWTK